MPAASNKTESKPSSEAVDPVKQFLNLVDKKVRNIEKRKVNCILLSSEFRIIWPWLPGETKIPITFSDWSRGCMMYIFTYAILMEPERYFFCVQRFTVLLFSGSLLHRVCVILCCVWHWSWSENPKWRLSQAWTEKSHMVCDFFFFFSFNAAVW